MSIKSIYIALLLLANFVANAQSDYHLIQNYRNDAALVINTKNYSFVFLSEYGSIKNYTGQNLKNYFFQSQEYDTDLNLVLFPSRLYSPKEKRFFQPDPKSQYASPYLFVGADPVNIVDRNGKEGKPLILYGEDHTQGGLTSKHFLDFQAEVPDAHYVPLSDFMSSSYIPLEEWNGNVFIKGHMGDNIGAELEAEVSHDKGLMRLSKQEGVSINFNPKTQTFHSGIDGKVVGKRLRRIAKLNKVEVKNIVAGGCNGTYAARTVGQGYASELEGGAKTLNTFGLRPNIQAVTFGENELSKKGYQNGIGRTRYYPVPEGFPYDFEKEASDGASPAKVTGLNLKRGERTLKFDKYASGEELNEMANGRIPPQINQFFDKHAFTY